MIFSVSIFSQIPPIVEVTEFEVKDQAKAFELMNTWKDLEKSIGSLSDKQKEKVFGNGKRWMNLEVMYPKTANVVDYDVAEIIFHGTLEYDETAQPIG